MKNEIPASLTVAVIGAGPVGLAAVAHLLERGFAPIVFEASPSVAGNYESFRHVQLFSPWRYNVDAAARRMLEAAGWTMPPEDELPTAGEMIDRYLAPFSRLPQVAPLIRFSHRVVSISREGFDKLKSKGRDDAPFVIRCQTGDRPLFDEKKGTDPFSTRKRGPSPVLGGYCCLPPFFSISSLRRSDRPRSPRGGSSSVMGGSPRSPVKEAEPWRSPDE